MKKTLRVAVCVPTHSSWQPEFGQSLCMAVADFLTSKFDNYEPGVKLSVARGSLLCQQRTDLVEDALASKCDYILFVDDDMVFSQDTIQLLLEADKDIIAANCVTKTMPPVPTARSLPGKPIYTRPDSTGVEEVLTVGTGIMLIKSSVFAKLPKPWFSQPWLANGNQQGEDVYFCQKARAHGFSIYISHDVSKNVLHTGEFHYNHYMVKEKKDGLLVT